MGTKVLTPEQFADLSKYVDQLVRAWDRLGDLINGGASAAAISTQGDVVYVNLNKLEEPLRPAGDAPRA